MLRPKLIRVRNILGVDEIEIRPGKVTVLEGGNATGKSSVLAALNSIMDGGHDATLLRKGEEEGEAVIVIEDKREDGTPGQHDGVEIRKRITSDKSDLKVTHPEMGRVSAPKGYVERLIKAHSFNPVEFLLTDNRVDVLLRAIDARVDSDELYEAVREVTPEDVDLMEVIDAAADQPALDAIETVRSAVYDERTGVNRIAKEKRATAGQLKESLPADGADPEEIREELEEAEHNLEAERSEALSAAEAIREECEAEVNAIREKAEERIAELQREIDEVRGSAERAAEEAREERDKRVQDVRENYGEEIDRWKDLTTTLRERVRAAEAAESTRENIREAEEVAERREEQSEVMTEALNRLDGLKERVLERLPIDGAEIRDGELYVNGIHMDRLNSQRRVEIAVEVAEMLAGDLGLAIVDDLELLDEEHFEALVARLEASPLTAIVTRVAQDGGDLTVRSTG